MIIPIQLGYSNWDIPSTVSSSTLPFFPAPRLLSLLHAAQHGTQGRDRRRVTGVPEMRGETPCTLATTDEGLKRFPQWKTWMQTSRKSYWYFLTWHIIPSSIRNTSSIRVHFPASYVSLTALHWTLKLVAILRTKTPLRHKYWQVKLDHLSLGVTCPEDYITFCTE